MKISYLDSCLIESTVATFSKDGEEGIETLHKLIDQEYENQKQGRGFMMQYKENHMKKISACPVESEVNK